MESKSLPPLKLPRLPLPSLPLASASARWQAVVKRDPTATTFVYAVLTTKIYCRASCPARLARRANVRFYDLPAQAEWAGFRACKRCNPDSLWSSSNRNDNPQVQLVQRTCQTIASLIQSGSRPTLQVLAAEMGLTTSHSHRVFKKVMGVTPGQYVARMTATMKLSLLGEGSEEEEEEEEEEEGKDGSSTASRGPEIGTVVLQPCGGGLEVGARWLGKDDDDAHRISHSAADGLLPWNDFDALFAAEARFVSMQEVQPMGELHAWRGLGGS